MIEYLVITQLAIATLMYCFIGVVEPIANYVSRCICISSTETKDANKESIETSIGLIRVFYNHIFLFIFGTGACIFYMAVYVYFESIGASIRCIYTIGAILMWLGIWVDVSVHRGINLLKVNRA